MICVSLPPALRKHIVASLALLLFQGAPGCDSRGQPTAVTSRAAPATLSASVTSAGTTTSPAAATGSATRVASAASSASVGAKPPRAPKPDLGFLDWVASHCLVDELWSTAYTRAWSEYRELEGDHFLKAGAPLPAPEEKRPPPAGSAEAEQLAAQLRQQWLASPRSHFVDCRFDIASRTGKPWWEDKGRKYQHYVAYLPQALLEDPAKVRGILMLVPGGNGGRSRYFLTELPDRSIFFRGSGGLLVKERTDRFIAAHPKDPQAIVVAIDSSGIDSINGPVEHISYDVPKHIADTYLGAAALDDLALGADGISSGSRVIMQIVWQKPDALNVAGFTCMSCGSIRPSSELALGEPDALLAWAKKLGERKRRGLFDARFTIGSRDGQLPCNLEFRELFAQGGVFADSEPVKSDCVAQRPRRHRCNLSYDGFAITANQAHHYGLLKQAWEAQLSWLLTAMAKAARAKAAQR